MDVSITTTKFSFPKYYGIFLLEMTFIHLLIQGLTKADVANRYCKEKKKRCWQLIILCSFSCHDAFSC